MVILVAFAEHRLSGVERRRDNEVSENQERYEKENKRDPEYDGRFA
jgi:hypothetical protein